MSQLILELLIFFLQLRDLLGIFGDLRVCLFEAFILLRCFALCFQGVASDVCVRVQVDLEVFDASTAVRVGVNTLVGALRAQVKTSAIAVPTLVSAPSCSSNERLAVVRTFSWRLRWLRYLAILRVTELALDPEVARI